MYSPFLPAPCRFRRKFSQWSTRAALRSVGQRNIRRKVPHLHLADELFLALFGRAARHAAALESRSQSVHLEHRVVLFVVSKAPLSLLPTATVPLRKSVGPAWPPQVTLGPGAMPAPPIFLGLHPPGG